MYAHAITAVVALVLAGGLYGLGDYMGHARGVAQTAATYEARLGDIARAVAESQVAAAERAREQSEAAARRTAAVRQERQRALSRVEALEHALDELPLRRECDFAAGELRALTDLHRGYFGSGAEQRVPDTVPDTTRTD